LQISQPILKRTRLFALYAYMKPHSPPAPSAFNTPCLDPEMATKKHSAADRIEFFFNNYSTLARNDCDALAVAIDPSCTATTSTQGAFSYTIIGNSQVVQFRAKISPLNLSLIDVAKAIHGPLIARTFLWGKLSDESKGENVVLVYCMERLPGENYSLLDSSIQNKTYHFEKQERTVKGLARYQYCVRMKCFSVCSPHTRFFAQSWTHPQPATNEMKHEVWSTYTAKLALLASHLPSRFTGLVKHCQDTLRHLFLPGIPWTLTHGDLCDTNLLVDPKSGELTGVPDWAEAEILPFGFALWGLETLLGAMDEMKGCWLYSTQHKYLEEVFWATFAEHVPGLTDSQWRGIRIGRLLGLLCRHGFKFTGVAEIPKDDSWDLSILDGQLLNDEKMWLTVD